MDDVRLDLRLAKEVLGGHPSEGWRPGLERLALRACAGNVREAFYCTARLTKPTVPSTARQTPNRMTTARSVRSPNSVTWPARGVPA